MKRLTTIFAASILAFAMVPASAQDDAASMSELLRLIEQGQARDNQEARQREARFNQDRNQQQQLLNQLELIQSTTLYAIPGSSAHMNQGIQSERCSTCSAVR